MNAADPLHMVEVLALLEEASTPLRHDVRNRIASIRNLSFFVRRKLASETVPERDPRVNEFLSKIEGEVQRTDEVIEAWSARVQQACERPTERASVLDCLRLAGDCARLPSSIGLEVAALAADTLEVECNREVLAFALRCLIENAGEALGSGVVSIRVQAEADQCRITVSDSGPGIADAARAMERFETTKPGHLGLGLCMARRVASRLGGDLLIGRPERGAEVSLLLPLVGASSQKGAPA